MLIYDNGHNFVLYSTNLNLIISVNNIYYGKFCTKLYYYNNIMFFLIMYILHNIF